MMEGSEIGKGGRGGKSGRTREEDGRGMMEGE